MKLIRAADLARACSMSEAIDAVAAGFVALSSGTANVPVRSSVPLRGGGVALAMPASLEGSPYFSAKIVSVAPGNRARGRSVINAAVLLGDSSTGETLAILDGSALTALRTGAGGGVAARALSREDSAVVALFGAGAQARTQLLAVAAVRPLREARVVAREPAHLAAFLVWAAAEPSLAGLAISASDPSHAIVGADIVITATTSRTPVFDGAALASGAHITAVGAFQPETRELDEAAMRGAHVVVDQREAALAEAGELRGLTAKDVVELGEVVAGTGRGRTSREERTVFKSVGNAIQDLVVAALAYERASELDLGEDIRFP
ncbi:MAG: ornithine cyclodeaminase family protein [Chloroflexi bacterium]|nr:ornithine cyclodeaminase family protein [Chloroflexota bacterium]